MERVTNKFSLKSELEEETQTFHRINILLLKIS